MEGMDRPGGMEVVGHWVGDGYEGHEHEMHTENSMGVA